MPSRQLHASEQFGGFRASSGRLSWFFSTTIRSVVILGACIALLIPAAAKFARGERQASVRGTESTRNLSTGSFPRDGFPVRPPVAVDYRRDRASELRRQGLLRGPLQGDTPGGAIIASVACSLKADCDDGNPCTNDVCDIGPGGSAGSGTCKQDPIANGGAGDCDDGVYCNGAETCQGASIFHCLGTCVGGPNNGLPCSTDAANNDNCPSGTCNTRVCVGGPNNNAACTYDSECTAFLGACSNPGNPCSGGAPLCNEITDSCQVPCVNDADCADPTSTTTTDGCTLDYCCVGGFYTRKTCVGGPKIGSLCDGTNATQCPGSTCGNPVSVPCDVSGTCVRGNPCGGGGDCINRFCVGGGPAFNNQPCVTDGDCGSGGTAGVCTDGTLCQPGRCCSTGTCSRRTHGACSGTVGSKKWFAGDSGRLDGTGTTCPSDVICPVYGAGVGEQGAFTVVAGPTSLSPFNNLMSGAPLRKLGDDYDFSPSPALIELTNFRFVGGVADAQASEVAVEFYDENGTLVEDLFFDAGGGIAVQHVVLEPPLAIPNKGFVATYVALGSAGSSVNARAELVWLATDTADHGSNDSTSLFVDTDFFGSPIVTPNFLKACAGGVRKGAPCGSHPDCPGSTCNPVPGILAFELEGPALGSPPNGACCTGASVCTQELEWVCTSLGHTFLGIGQACNQCSTDSLNFGASCAVNSDCTFCVGGINEGLPCPANPCTGGACLGTCVPVCGQGACCAANGSCAITAGAGSCVGVFQGFGSSCVPNCCDQPLASYTGADSCEDVIIHNLILPSPGNEITVTITGDNSVASSLQHCVGGTNNGALCTSDAQCSGGGVCTDDDSCFPPSAPGAELGWLEGFSIDDCAYVRVDLCCTDTNPGTPTVAEPKVPAYSILYDNCPCGQTLFTKRDPNRPLEPAHAQGTPYCREDNTWNKFGPLRAGTYYYPILSNLLGDFGKYQLHLTAQACPEAACCHNICTSASGPACTTHADCVTPGEVCINGVCQETCGRDSDCSSGQCQSTCELLNILECQDIGGAFLAPPNRGTTVTFCGGICADGSCCTGPGACSDEFTPGVLGMTIDNCDTLNGVYVGGFHCFGGTCDQGPRAGLSCQTDAQCSGGICNGDPQSLAQPTPCPVCDIGSADHCQPFDNSVKFRPSDLSLPGGARVADDFIPNGNGVTTVCVWGAYQAGDSLGGRTDCADDVQDNFTITIYNAHPATGLPDTVKGVSAASGANVVKAPQPLTAYEDLHQVRVFGYKLTLDSPIGGLTPGNTYWLEVNNNTDIPAIQSPNCFWSWMALDSAYDDYSASGAASGYGVAAAATGDLAWCLDVSVTPTAAPMRACCDCQGSCSLQTKRDCDSASSAWHVDDLACGGGTCSGGPPKEDNCQDVLAAILGNAPVGEGTYLWDNHCASTDGPNPVPHEFGSISMSRDLWFKFVSDCSPNSDVTFSTCPSATADAGGIDSMIAVYHNAATPTACQCPTPANQDALLWPQGLGNDEGCTGVLIGGGGVVQSDPINPSDDIDPGDCFMIRVGGSAGGSSDEGTGALVIDCNQGTTPPICGDNLVNQPTEECDGTDDLGCPGAPGACTAGCTCGCNCDASAAVSPYTGPVGFSDISAVVSCVLGHICWCGKRCDINCDGYVNQCDLDAVLCRFQGGGPNCCAPSCGACCLSGGTGCGITSDTACTSQGGVFLGNATNCPTQNAAIVTEPGGQIFVHVIGPPVDCTQPTPASADRAGCPPTGPYIDPWVSPPGDPQMCHNFGAANAGPIPAGFFNLGSDAFTGVVCFEGDPLNVAEFGKADTLITRSHDPFGRCDLPTPDEQSADLTITALSLTTPVAGPITVTYNGGQNSELWNVSVDLAPEGLAPGTPQSRLTARRTQCNGGTFTSTIYVQPRFTFSKRDNPNVGLQRIFNTRTAGLPAVKLDQPNPQPWVTDLDPGLGASGDVCSAFHAGVHENDNGTSCDCNGNGIRDRCDVENGTSTDVNNDGIPDECVCVSAAASAPLAEPSPVAKNRYLALVPGNAGKRTAIRVRPIMRNGVPVDPDEYAWVGPAKGYPDSGGVTFYAAQLQCDAYYRDWGDIPVLHLYGSAVAPDSTYEVDMLTQPCPSTLNAFSFSGSLTVATAKWGDVIGLTPGSLPNGAVTFLDIGSIVSKFKGEPTAPSKIRAQLQPMIPRPNANINFLDVSADVEAFKSKPYPFAVSSCLENQ